MPRETIVDAALRLKGQQRHQQRNDQDRNPPRKGGSGRRLLAMKREQDRRREDHSEKRDPGARCAGDSHQREQRHQQPGEVQPPSADRDAEGRPRAGLDPDQQRAGDQPGEHEHRLVVAIDEQAVGDPRIAFPERGRPRGITQRELRHAEHRADHHDQQHGPDQHDPARRTRAERREGHGDRHEQ